jgi:hypothetical protein
MTPWELEFKGMKLQKKKGTKKGNKSPKKFKIKEVTDVD